jgi:hypothetical protein
MKRLNIATLLGTGAVAAGLALSPFGAAMAQAADNQPDRDGYMECIDQQPDGPDGREDDYTIQTCCILHDGTVETDYDGSIWCNIPAVEAEQGQPPAPPTKLPTAGVTPGEVFEPAAPTGTVRPPRVLDPAVIAPVGKLA